MKNVKNLLLLILFLPLFSLSQIAQNLRQEVTSDNCLSIECPVVPAVCADVYEEGVLGYYVEGWPLPTVYNNCFGGSDTSFFLMKFELPESHLVDDCWEFNYVQRVGGSGGHVKLWTSNHPYGDDPYIRTPFLQVCCNSTHSIDLKYTDGNYTVELWIYDDDGVEYGPYDTQTVQHAIGTYETYHFTLLAQSGVYQFKFKFTTSDSKNPSNKNKADNINIKGLLNDDGCGGGIDQYVIGPPTGFYPVGTYPLSFTVYYTDPNEVEYIASCTFDFLVEGVESFVEEIHNGDCGEQGYVIIRASSYPVPSVPDYQYSVDGGAWTNFSDGFYSTINLDEGTYIIHVRDLTLFGECETVNDLTVTIEESERPLPPISGGDQEECEENPIQTLTATATVVGGEGVVVWYDQLTGGSVVNPILNSVGTVTYYAETLYEGCSSLTRTPVILTILDSPDAPVSGGDQTECEEDPIQTLTATATSDYTIIWYDVSDNVVTNPILNTVGTVTYYAESISDNDCVSLTRTAVTLTIDSSPEPPISGGDQEECAEEPVQTLTATATSDYDIVWYDDGGNVVTNPTLNIVGTVTYYAEAVGEDCSSLTRTPVILTILESPEAPVSGGDQTECETDPIQTLTATATSDYDIVWYDGSGNVVTDPSLSEVGTITYYAESISDNGCASLTRTSVTLTILFSPDAPISGGDQTECEENPIQTLTASATSDYDIVWYNESGDVVDPPSLSEVGTITYYAESVDGECSSLTRTAVTLTILPAPDAPVSGGDQEECEEDPIQTLTATATSDYDIVWYNSDGDIVIEPILSEVGTVTYYAESVSEDECVSLTRTAVTLTILPSPDAPISGGDQTECEENPIQTLTATATSDYDIVWYDGNGDVVTDPSLSEIGTVTYYAESVSEDECVSLTRTAVTLTILDSPEPPISGGDQEECEENPIQTLTATATSDEGGIVWYDGNGDVVENPTLSEVGTVTYYAETVGEECSSLTRTAVTLTILDSPEPPISGGDQEECEEIPIQTLTATATSDEGEVVWYNSDGDIVIDPSLSEVGTVTYYAETVGEFCVSLTRTPVTLTIYLAPTVDAGEDQEMCSNSNVTLNGQIGGSALSGTWTGGTGTFDPDNLTLDAVYTPSQDEIDAGFVTLTLTTNDPEGPCEPVSDDVTITITLEPTVDAGEDGETCELIDYQLNGSASNYSSILWTGGSGTFDDNTILNPIYTPLEGEVGDIILTLTAYGNGSCEDASDEMILTITLSPIVDAGPDGVTCEGNNFEVTNASAENYSSIHWETDGLGILYNASTINPIYTPLEGEIGDITLTLFAYGNGSCEDVTDEMILTITPAPIVNAGPDEFTCEDTPFTITGATVENYTTISWTHNGSGNLFNSSTISPTYEPSVGETGEITLVVDVHGSTFCEDVSDEMVLTIVTQSVAFAGEDATICEDDSYTILDATASSYNSLVWTTSGEGTFDDNTLLHPTYTPSFNDITIGSVTLTLTVYGVEPCGNAVDEMVLTINTLPQAYAGRDGTVCEGDSYELFEASSSGVSVLWITSGDGTFDDNTLTNPYYTPGSTDIENGSVILTITVIGEEPCGEASDSMELFIMDTPTVDAGENGEICESDLSYKINGSSATHYTQLLWTTSGDGVFDDNTILEPTYTYGIIDLSDGVVTLTLTASSDCGSVSDFIELIINTNPIVNAGDDKTIEIETSTTLDGSATGGSGLYSYYWIPEDKLVDPNIENPTTVDLFENTTFLLQVTDGYSGCIGTDEVVIFVEDIPVDPVVANDDYDSTLMNNSVTIDILDNDLYPSEELPTIELCGDPEHGFVTINDDGTVTYTPNIDYVGIDAFCYRICDAVYTEMCDEATVYLNIYTDVIKDFEIFNTFTPNGDGINDKWYIKGIEHYPDNKVHLFNRWGDQINFLEHYDNSGVYWDGKSDKNNILPDGTYYYVFYINIDGVDKTFTGWVFMHGAHQ